MNSNKPKISFAKKMDQQIQLPDQQLPALQRSPPKMSVMLKKLMAALTPKPQNPNEYICVDLNKEL